VRSIGGRQALVTGLVKQRKRDGTREGEAGERRVLLAHVKEEKQKGLRDLKI